MSARDFALVQLDRLDLPGWPKPSLSPALARKASSPADPRDLGLAEQLEIGVVKNLLLLQHLLSHYARRPLRKLDPLVQKILALALYQIRFLDRIPASAAVNEAVEQCRRFGRPHAAALTNACLRAALRQPLDLPPRGANPAAYAELALSHPQSLFARLAAIVGPEKALSICEHDNATPPCILRLEGGIDVSALAGPGITLIPHQTPGLLVVTGARRKQLAAWAASGMAQVQDATAAGVVPALPLSPEMTVLDRCCGAGTKTLQLAAVVGPAGRVVAIDPSLPRCDMLRQSLADRAIKNVQVYQAEWLPPPSAGRPALFDLALLDLPCSNSGVMARRPDARYHQDEPRLQSLRRLQLQIVEDTLPAIAPGGWLAYSTCSIWPEENQDQVQAIMKAHPQMSLVSERLTLPSCDEPDSRYHDGGYLALLQRR